MPLNNNNIIYLFIIFNYYILFLFILYSEKNSGIVVTLKNKTFFGFFVDTTYNMLYNKYIKLRRTKQMMVSMTFLLSVALFGWFLDN